MSEASEKMLHFVWSMGNLNAISLVACDFLCSLKCGLTVCSSQVVIGF